MADSATTEHYSELTSSYRNSINSGVRVCEKSPQKRLRGGAGAMLDKNVGAMRFGEVSHNAAVGVMLDRLAIGDAYP
jgi:hypothetical protein